MNVHDLNNNNSSNNKGPINDDSTFDFNNTFILPYDKSNNLNTFHEPLINSIQNNNTLDIKTAIKEISWIAFPTILFFICLFMQQMINLIFIGHTYPDAEKKYVIDAVGISHLYINCTLLSIVTGLISGFETLGSNAYGSKNYYLLGLYFHRAQLISYFITFFLFIFHFSFAVQVLSLLGLDPRVIAYVSSYIKVMMFFVIFDVQCTLNFRYLNIIDKSHINLIILVVCAILHPLWCYIFIIFFDFGVVGGGISLIISQFLASFFGVVYMIYYNPLPESIFLYNKDSFIGWIEYLKIALPSAFLMCSEWWAFEIMSIIAIWISDLDYTVHILIASLNGNFYTISIGFGMASSILVGKSICTSSVEVVKKYAKIIFIFGLSFMTFLCLLIFISRKYILYIFIDHQDVIQKGTEVITILCVLNIFDLSQTVLAYTCRGLGKQLIASLFAFINFYIAQSTAAIIFGKWMNWGVYGIWFGSLISCALCSIMYMIVLMSFDFNKIQKETLQRIENDKGKLNGNKEVENEQNNLLRKSAEL